MHQDQSTDGDERADAVLELVEATEPMLTVLADSGVDGKRHLRVALRQVLRRLDVAQIKALRVAIRTANIAGYVSGWRAGRDDARQRLDSCRQAIKNSGHGAGVEFMDPTR